MIRCRVCKSARGSLMVRLVNQTFCALCRRCQIIHTAMIVAGEEAQLPARALYQNPTLCIDQVTPAKESD